MTSQFAEPDVTIVKQSAETDAIADEELMSTSGGIFWSKIGGCIADYGQFFSVAVHEATGCN